MLTERLRGYAPAVTGWITLDKARVQAFADVTEDWQFIHLDESRAAETPFGGTVAHGFLTMSMLSALSYQATADIDGVASAINRGFDRLRFVTPVRVGARIRGRFEIASVTEKPGAVDVAWDVTVEIDGADKPALVARWLTRMVPQDGAPG